MEPQRHLVGTERVLWPAQLELTGAIACPGDRRARVELKRCGIRLVRFFRALLVALYIAEQPPGKRVERIEYDRFVVALLRCAQRPLAVPQRAPLAPAELPRSRS